MLKPRLRSSSASVRVSASSVIAGIVPVRRARTAVALTMRDARAGSISVDCV